MSIPPSKLLLELSAEARHLYEIHHRLQAGHYRDNCACRPGEPCPLHAGISNQVDAAYQSLQAAALPLIIMRLPPEDRVEIREAVKKKLAAH
jgi:hypothetical protein